MKNKRKISFGRNALAFASIVLVGSGITEANAMMIEGAGGDSLQPCNEEVTEEDNLEAFLKELTETWPDVRKNTKVKDFGVASKEGFVTISKLIINGEINYMFVYSGNINGEYKPYNEYFSKRDVYETNVNTQETRGLGEFANSTVEHVESITIEQYFEEKGIDYSWGKIKNMTIYEFAEYMFTIDELRKNYIILPFEIRGKNKEEKICIYTVPYIESIDNLVSDVKEKKI